MRCKGVAPSGCALHSINPCQSPPYVWQRAPTSAGGPSIDAGAGGWGAGIEASVPAIVL